jgi:hypothetical protein
MRDVKVSHVLRYFVIQQVLKLSTFSHLLQEITRRLVHSVPTESCASCGPNIVEISIMM